MISYSTFNVFINDLALILKSYDIGVSFGDEKVCILMYADDIALVADTVLDLQKKINCLEQYCAKWGLTVNMDKTKVVVFRNGGFLKQCEKWFYAGKQITVEASYNYLGVIFGSTLNWARCAENLSCKALIAVASLRRLYFRLKKIANQHRV